MNRTFTELLRRYPVLAPNTENKVNGSGYSATDSQSQSEPNAIPGYAIDSYSKRVGGAATIRQTQPGGTAGRNPVETTQNINNLGLRSFLSIVGPHQSRINMIRFILILGLIAFGCKSNAQIVYDLPESVIKKIDERILEKRDQKYLVLLSRRDSSKYSISIEQISSNVESFKIIQETLVDKTNRFVKVKDMMIPLITWDDIYLADYGRVYYPDAKNEKRRVGKRKVNFVSDTPLIVFDLSGKIY